MDVARWLPWLLAGVLLMGAVNVLWLVLVRWWYRLRAPPPERLTTRCQDGWELSVYLRRAPTRRFEEPVLLCHGLAANRYTFDFEPPYSLSHVLAEAGFAPALAVCAASPADRLRAAILDAAAAGAPDPMDAALADRRRSGGGRPGELSPCARASRRSHGASRGSGACLPARRCFLPRSPERTVHDRSAQRLGPDL